MPNLYLVLGRDNFPYQSRLFTEKDLEGLQILPKTTLSHLKVVKIDLPWGNILWDTRGGRGKSPFSEGTETQMLRVPKNLTDEVKKYAIWLSRQ